MVIKIVRTVNLKTSKRPKKNDNLKTWLVFFSWNFYLKNQHNFFEWQGELEPAIHKKNVRMGYNWNTWTPL